MNTTRLEKQRITYLIVILIAARWFAVGTFIRFSSLAAGQKAFEDLKTGAAVLPVNADQMAPKLELLANQYGLTCAKESWAGTTLVYERELCSPANAALHPSVEDYSRRDDPQKIDLVSAIQTMADEESAADYFLAVAELALTEDSSANAATWLRASLQEVIESGASATTTVRREADPRFAGRNHKIQSRRHPIIPLNIKTTLCLTHDSRREFSDCINL
jgi:hypothetical protein